MSKKSSSNFSALKLDRDMGFLRGPLLELNLINSINPINPNNSNNPINPFKPINVINPFNPINSFSQSINPN